MANGTQEGLDGASKEPSEDTSARTSEESDDLFSGSLESPDGDESNGSEQPNVDPAPALKETETPPPAQAEDTGKSAGESGDSDTSFFADFEKDIPEELKAKAENVKKKMQAAFTKKTQALAAEKLQLSQEMESLKNNQITPKFREDYGKMYGYYEKIVKNPAQGIQELATKFGVTLPQQEPSEAKPTTKEITSAELDSPEAVASYVAQEIRKAVAEVREKEVKPLQQRFSSQDEFEARQGHVHAGAKAVEAMYDQEGFLSEDKTSISVEGRAAMLAVAGGHFVGEKALENAFNAIMANKFREDARKIKMTSEEQIAAIKADRDALKTGLQGATDLPGGHRKITTTPPSTPSSFWGDVSQEQI